MGYKNKYGITKIRPSRTDALSVSWDYDTNPNKRYPVFLFTPNMDDTDEHYHIPLTRKQAAMLKDWLDDYLNDIKKYKSARPFFKKILKDPKVRALYEKEKRKTAKSHRKFKSDAEVEKLLDGDMSDFITKNKFTKTSFKMKIPPHHKTFYTKKAKKRLTDFDEWAEKNPPKNSDIKALRKKLAKKS